MIEAKVSARGSVSHWTVTPTGRRVTVQTPRGLDTPEGIAVVADQAVAPTFRRGSRR